MATQEIGVILDYLRVLDNRRQDIALTAVLTSAIGGLRDEELALIKSAYPDLPFWKAVFSFAGEESWQEPVSENPEESAGLPDVEIRRKLARCLDQMDVFREIVPYTPMHELLWKILDETGYRDYVSAMPGGAQRRANLEMLVEKARAFESTSYKGLFHFLGSVERLRKM